VAVFDPLPDGTVENGILDSGPVSPDHYKLKVPIPEMSFRLID
jgi:hypothetical protein